MSLLDEPLGASKYRALMFYFESGEPDRPHCLVSASDARYLCFWFGQVRGRWEIIGLDSLPRPRSVVRAGEDDETSYLMDWLGPLADRYEVVLRTGEVEPLAQADLRSAPLREASRWRAAFLLDQAVDTAPDLGWLKPEQLTKHQQRQVEILRDAHSYVYARRRGVSASDLIARKRGISRARADQRIGQARVAGILPPAEYEGDPGLTDAGRALEKELLKASGVRIIGEA